MKKNILRLSFAIVLVFTFLATVPAHKSAVAQVDEAFLGEFCWVMEPYIDTIKVRVFKDGEFYHFYGRWRAAGFYSVAIAGSAAMDPDYGMADFQFLATDYQDLGITWWFHAKLGAGFNGPWAFETTDGFTNSGTLTRLTCTGDMVRSGPNAMLIK
jgi:hypothetical protein